MSEKARLVATTVRAEDQLHPPTADDSWYESYWFAFYVPERNIMVYAYPWFRTALGVYGGGVMAWDTAGHAPWTILHNDYAWARRFAGPDSILEGGSIITPQGIRIDCLEERHHYRIRYAHPRLAFDVTFTPAGDANIMAATTAEEGVFASHVDQPGHYAGTLRVGDTWLPVDCFLIRDRSWGPRRDDKKDMHIGYFYATASNSDAFLMVGHGRETLEDFDLISGYLIRDGVRFPLASASANIARNDLHAPKRCTIQAEDEMGRTLVAEGEAITFAGLQQQPGMFTWTSLARWRFSDIETYGELQESWHPDRYRSFVRERQHG